jgi:hypothetical protein
MLAKQYILMSLGTQRLTTGRLGALIVPAGPQRLPAEKHALKRTVVVNERKQLRLHVNTIPPGAITSGNTIHSLMVRFLLDATANVDYPVRGLYFGEIRGLRRARASGPSSSHLLTMCARSCVFGVAIDLKHCVPTIEVTLI